MKNTVAKNLAPLPGAQPDTSFDFPSASPEMGKLVARHRMQMSDPAFMPHLARRNVPQERVGASYQTTMAVAPHIAPEAGPTLANARLLPPAINRSSAYEFAAGEADFA